MEYSHVILIFLFRSNVRGPLTLLHCQFSLVVSLGERWRFNGARERMGKSPYTSGRMERTGDKDGHRKMEAERKRWQPSTRKQDIPRVLQGN